jgi:hypothetical protein
MDEYPLNHLLGLPYAVLQRIVWHLRAPAAGALANCIRDPTMRAAVQSAPAFMTDVFWFRRARWRLPPPCWLVSGRALTRATGNEEFSLFWRQLGDTAADVAPWLNLVVEDCDAIGDEHLERLGRICRRLTLGDCPNVSRVDLLGPVPGLMLSSCGRVTDLTGLGAQESLSLRQLPISDLRPVGGVANLSVWNCPLVRDLEGLGAPGQVTVSLSVLKITSLRQVGGVKEIYVDNCPISLDGIDVTRLEKLTLHNVPVKDLIELTGCKAFVHATQCDNITSGKGLEDCESVLLSDLRGLYDVQSLGGVPRVSVRSCPKVLELWRSEPGQRVELTNMAQVKSLDTLALAASIEIN